MVSFMPFLPTQRRSSLGGLSVSNVSDDELTPRRGDDEVDDHPSDVGFSLAQYRGTIFAVSTIVFFAVFVSVSILRNSNGFADTVASGSDAQVTLGSQASQQRSPPVDEDSPADESPAELTTWRADPRSKIRIKMRAEQITNVTVAYQKPASPRRVLLLFHGCSHDAEHFFQLPEERIIVRKALHAHYVPVAISSKDRRSRCWSTDWPPDQNVDVERVVGVYHDFARREGLASMPVFALGASSGGQFVTILAHAMKLAGIVVQVAPGFEEAMNTPSIAGQQVAFVHMTNDRSWATPLEVDDSAGMLKKNGASVVTFACSPKALTPTVLSDRIDSLSPENSAKIYRLFVKAGLLDGRGLLTADPRGGLALAHLSYPPEMGGDSLRDLVELYSAAIQEELNMLYSAHELTSEHFDRLLTWFDSILLSSASSE